MKENSVLRYNLEPTNQTLLTKITQLPDEDLFLGSKLHKILYLKQLEI